MAKRVCSVVENSKQISEMNIEGILIYSLLLFSYTDVVKSIGTPLFPKESQFVVKQVETETIKWHPEFFIPQSTERIFCF